jgi:hypothetical protein
MVEALQDSVAQLRVDLSETQTDSPTRIRDRRRFPSSSINERKAGIRAVLNQKMSKDIVITTTTRPKRGIYKNILNRIPRFDRNKESHTSNQQSYQWRRNESIEMAAGEAWKADADLVAHEAGNDNIWMDIILSISGLESLQGENDEDDIYYDRNGADKGTNNSRQKNITEFRFLPEGR